MLTQLIALASPTQGADCLSGGGELESSVPLPGFFRPLNGDGSLFIKCLNADVCEHLIALRLLSASCWRVCFFLVCGKHSVCAEGATVTCMWQALGRAIAQMDIPEQDVPTLAACFRSC